ncbi:MAG: hypothetical protein WA085_02550 [Sphingobium sp.]|uniref:hypothetical protein n=1 Tax=Sphingobium sp. CECT 9361 TaxID=2845384 RepID=UPI001E5F88D7|nr:hypothetical protein [Sphingobium sp. CECT 9361]CAH0350147.1 hypothetical protein SPH9361_00963 [Sphingobium sp. CECT 9361]
MKRFVLAALAAAVTVSPAQADTYYWPAPASPINAEGVRYVLPTGTPLMMRTLTQISSKENKPGDRVYLEVAENVSYRGQVVIPAGSPVVAEVAGMQRNGHLGKKGKIEIRLIEVQTPSGPVRIMGRAADEGKSGTAASIATMFFVSALGGFLIHGTSALIPNGTAVQGQLANDLKFTWYRNASEQTARADVTDAGVSNFNF